MNGARKGLFALGAALMAGGSMLVPIGTASAQTTTCQKAMANYCTRNWSSYWTSYNDCYAYMVETQCDPFLESADTGRLPLYRRPVASA